MFLLEFFSIHVNFTLFEIGLRKCWQITQRGSILTTGMSLNFWCLRSVNYTKFIEDCMMITLKNFYEKMFTNGLNMGLPLCAWVKKIVLGVETPWLSGKEKVQGAAVSKEGHAYSLLGHERSHHYWFSWKRCVCK